MLNRKILKMFLVCICYVVFFYPNTAFGIDWEQWRIPDNSSIPDAPEPVRVDPPSYDRERPAPRQEREDTRKREEARKRAGETRKRAEETRKKEVFKLNKKKGRQAYRAGNWKEAIDYYKKALREFHNDRGSRRNLTKAQNAFVKERSAKAVKDLHESVYWSMLAADAIANNDYEAAREFAEFSAPQFPAGNIQFPLVPDVPAPVPADPQIRLYSILIKEVNQTTSELKLIDTNLKQAEEKKRESEKKIDLQKIKLEELKQEKYERKKEDAAAQEETDRLVAETQTQQEEIDRLTKAQAILDEAQQKEMDGLIAAARALLDEAEKEDKDASKKIDSLTSQKKEKKDNLAKLQQRFDVVDKHPEQAGEILKELEGGKQ